MSSIPASRFSAVIGVIVLATLPLASSAQADTISTTLAAAGPSNFAILFLSTSGQPR